MGYILQIIIIAALLLFGVVIYYRFKKREERLNLHLIEAMQQLEHRTILIETVESITFSLLSMPDNDLELFDNHFLDGMQAVSICGDMAGIRVFRNAVNEQGEHFFTQQFSWEAMRNHIDDQTEHKYPEGWYELFSQSHIINKPVSELTAEENSLLNKFSTTNALCLLVIPVYFQERFWGMVWYEDNRQPDCIDKMRVNLLRSVSLMIVCAVHRKGQARLIIEATDRMRVMLDSMPLSCFIYDGDGNILDVNTHCLRFFNYKTRERLSRNIKKLYPAIQPDGRDSATAMHDNIQLAIREGERKFEWIHRMPSTGELIPTEVSMIRITYNGVYAVAAYVYDMREHKRMISEIEHRGYLLNTVNSAASVLLLSDPDGFQAALFRSLSMMARAVGVERIFVWEYSQEANTFSQIYEWLGDATVFGRRIKEISYRKDSEKLVSRLLRGLCLTGLTSSLSLQIQKDFNLESTRSYMMIPIFLSNKMWGLIGFGDMSRERDFSESDETIVRSGSLLLATALLRNEMMENTRTNAKKLSAALEEAQAASRSKSEFLSTMSHEMRTPMNAIIGMTVLGKDADGIERKDYAFSRIEAASTHLLGVINDVLDMSKIEAGMITLYEEAFYLGDMLDSVMAVNRFRIDEKNQIFSIDLDPDIPKILVADSQRLAQVLTNLLSNASKFTGDGKSIELNISLVEKSTVDCEIRFDVIDEGIGLSQEQQSKLFRSFVQAESSTTRKFGGTGLGLAISKHIVELMSGNIWVRSKEGKGSTFSFIIKARLPDNGELAKMRPNIEETDSPIFFEGRTLLIAEDIDINFEIINAMLEDSGLDIIPASNGEEALALFASDPEKFDLIFMDIHMPIMDGYQATERIRALPHPHAKEVPIIAMTANVFKEAVEKSLDCGMNGHIGKPIDFSAVKAVLKKYLG